MQKLGNKCFSPCENEALPLKRALCEARLGSQLFSFPFSLEPGGEERAVTSGSYALGGRWKNRCITQKYYINLRIGMELFNISP